VEGAQAVTTSTCSDDTVKSPREPSPALKRFWELSGEKLELLYRQYDWSAGSPVYTVNGEYTLRGWTEWTEGFAHARVFCRRTGGGSFRGTARP
jgi:hypothetical protein